MVHQMKLYSKSFTKIKSGQKPSELRLNDDKRQQVKVGDTIVFTHSENSHEKLLALVTYLKTYTTFKDLYVGVKSDYPDWEEESFVQGMYMYYTPEEERKFGALEIGIKIIGN